MPATVAWHAIPLLNPKMHILKHRNRRHGLLLQSWAYADRYPQHKNIQPNIMYSSQLSTLLMTRVRYRRIALTTIPQ